MAGIRGVRRLLGTALVLAAAVMGSAGAAAAQDARVLGRVTDGVGNPVAQATVTLVGESGAAQSATSGASGGFQFQGVAPGVYTLQAARDGFVVREQRITVRAGRVVTPVVRLNTAGRAQRGGGGRPGAGPLTRGSDDGSATPRAPRRGRSACQTVT